MDQCESEAASRFCTEFMIIVSRNPMISDLLVKLEEIPALLAPAAST
jgi:hypothetical protein